MQTARSDDRRQAVGRGMETRTAPTILKTSISNAPASEDVNEEDDEGPRPEPLTSTRQDVR